MNKVFVIALRNSLERRAPLINQLNEYGIDYYMIDAFNGKLVNNAGYKLIKIKHNNVMLSEKMTPLEMGCTLSHTMAITMAKALGLEYAIILEDDCRLLPDFKETIVNVIEDLETLPEIKFVYLGGILWGNGIFRGPKIKGRLFEAEHNNISGTHGYLVPKRGYDILLDTYYSLHNTTDDLLNEIFYHDKKHKIAAVRPWICYQDTVPSDLWNNEIVDKSRSKL